MLSQLHIENVAIIDNLDIYFEKGLNILTGETGAGKSIIIDSINMILGERTSRDLIRSGESKAIVEALFHISGDAIRNELSEYGIEPDEEDSVLISREIFLEGKNICRINGRLVTASILKEIGKLLVNIHGQHDNQSLLQVDKHIRFLDTYAGAELISTKEEYKSIYEDMQKIKAKIKSISGDGRENERKIDLLQFQIDEIEGAKLKDDEEEILTQKRNLLSNSEKLITAVSNGYALLYEGTPKGVSVHDNLAETLKNIEQVSKYDPKLKRIYDSLQDISFQMDDVVYELREYRENIEYDPDLLQTVEQRLDLIYRLKRKYGSSIEEILQYRDKVSQELEDISNREEILDKLHKQKKEKMEKLKDVGDILSKLRVEAAESLQEKVVKELHDLDMNKTIFKIQIDKLIDGQGNPEFSKDGYDKVEFLISTNIGEPLKPLVKIASGGEMSRIMLSIKTVLADIDLVETLIFDEVDTGVSGRAAQKIAEKLAFMSRNKQILCITHLPQIASMADQHYLIEKAVAKEKASTKVLKLSFDNRKREIARILGGDLVTDLTLKHAEEMINIADKIKNEME